LPIPELAKEISKLDPEKILTPEDIEVAKEKISAELPAKNERRDIDTPDDSEKYTVDSHKRSGIPVIEKKNIMKILLDMG